MHPNVGRRNDGAARIGYLVLCIGSRGRAGEIRMHVFVSSVSCLTQPVRARVSVRVGVVVSYVRH